MAGERFPIPTAIAHQVTRVLRLADGDELLLLDGLGMQVRCRLERGDCAVLERVQATGEPTHQLRVWQALLKGDHLEPVIRHGTEIGIARFGLFVSERCVARHVSPRKLERLQAVAREAAEQSERGIVPPVDPPLPFAAALQRATPASVLLFERHGGKRLTELELPPAVFIGPEGGFSPAEVAGSGTSWAGDRRSGAADPALGDGGRGGCGGCLVAHRRLRLGSLHGRSRPHLPARLPLLPDRRR